LQHLADQLNYELTPIEFMQSQFPEDFQDIEAARSAIGSYGLTGKQQVLFNDVLATITIAIVIYLS
jgi:hypothetical protein